MCYRPKLVAFSLTALLLSAVSAAATPVPFNFAGPGQVNVDTDPGTEVQLTSLIDGTILDLNVFLEITGGHMEDLDLFLTSPGGTTVHFRRDFTTPTIPGDPIPHQSGPIMATFDDDAPVPHDFQPVNEASVGGIVGTFRPFQSLGAFNGQQLAGVWTLTILDDFFPDDGETLLSWNITGSADIEQVPEPVSTLGLLAGGVGWLAALRRRQHGRAI